MQRVILVVSPDADFVHQIRSHLEEGGRFQVTGAASAHEGLNLANSNFFEVAILDGEIKDIPVAAFSRDLTALQSDIKILVYPPDNNPQDPSLEGLISNGLLNKPFSGPEVGGALARLLSDQSAGSNSQVNVLDDLIKQWLEIPETGVEKANQILKSTGAESVLIVIKGQTAAAAGRQEENLVNNVTAFLSRYWREDENSELARFIRVDGDGSERFIYATKMVSNVVLVLVYPYTTTLQQIRRELFKVKEELQTNYPTTVELRQEIANKALLRVREQGRTLEAMKPFTSAISQSELESLGVSTSPVSQSKLDSLAASTGPISQAELDSLAASAAPISQAELDSLAASAAPISQAELDSLAASTGPISQAELDSLAASAAPISQAELDSLAASAAPISQAELDSLAASAAQISQAELDSLAASNGPISQAELDSLVVSTGPISQSNFDSLAVSSVPFAPPPVAVTDQPGITQDELDELSKLLNQMPSPDPQPEPVAQQGQAVPIEEVKTPEWLNELPAQEAAFQPTEPTSLPATEPETAEPAGTPPFIGNLEQIESTRIESPVEVQTTPMKVIETSPAPVVAPAVEPPGEPMPELDFKLPWESEEPAKMDVPAEPEPAILPSSPIIAESKPKDAMQSTPVEMLFSPIDTAAEPISEIAAQPQVPPQAAIIEEPTLSQAMPKVSTLPPALQDFRFHYTCVLTPQDHNQYLARDLSDRLAVILPQFHLAQGWKLINITVRPQYLSWTVGVPVGVCPHQIIREIRTLTSAHIYANFAEIARNKTSDDFWSTDYMAVSGIEPPPPSLISDFVAQAWKSQIPAAA